MKGDAEMQNKYPASKEEQEAYIKKNIASLERRAKYSKNPLEQRTIRAKISELHRALKEITGKN